MLPPSETTVAPKSVAACETQPVTAEGLRLVLSSCPDFEFCGVADTLETVRHLVTALNPALLFLDKALGLPSILEEIPILRHRSPGMGVIVWGVSMTDAEALRLLQAGARGILRKTADLRSIVACLRAVSSGSTWMEENVFREASRTTRSARSDLTARETQVLELIERGLKNKEIARELGIRPGTVKIHLKHIFEKTGVRGRYGLALSGLKDKGLLSLPAV